MNESTAIAFEARLEWRSEQATHVDRMLVRPAALHGDGRWLAAGETARLDGDASLDPAPWCQPRGLAVVEVARSGLRLPPDLVAGRHYPCGMFGHALDAPRDPRPVRLVADDGDGRLRVDPNHPLAATPARMVLAASTGTAAPALRLAELFSGPGLQRQPANPRDCYFVAGALSRADEAADVAFHARARLTQHLDARCRAELAAIHGRLLQPGMRALDLMASIDSHLPQDLHGLTLAGLGMNPEELAANPRLAERVVQDLNGCPVLPWPDASFDAVLNTAAIEYLVRPADVLAEVRRVLKPGGLFCVAFSDRWFPSKAIAVWSRLHDFERMGLVLSLFHQAAFGDLYTESLRGAARPADDRYFAAREFSDPLFLVRGRKRA
jgi:SAM-dependent methyltransferase